jgi:carnitine-CoA ligase
VEHDYADRLSLICDSLPDLTHVVVRGECEGAVDLPGVKLLHLDDLLAAADDDLPDRNRPADLTCLTYTGGTTGPSKGCMISHNYMLSMAHNSLRSPRRPDDLSWTPLPLFHLNAASAITSSAVIGAAHAVAPRFSLSGFWPEIKRTGATRAMLLGAMVNLVATMPDTPDMLACVGQIEHMGGAPYTAEEIGVFKQRFGIRRVGSQVYGLTECAPLVSAPVGVEGPWGSSGRRNDLFDVRIVDEEDRELPPGQAGEVIARPRRPHVMFEGYWRRPEATQAVMRNMWFHTGDIGRFDDDGWFWFVDRKKDYMRRRGENVSSRELEAAFAAHDAVQEVVAHAVPSELSEDDIKIVVVLHDGADLTEEELLRWAFDRVPYYAIPRYVEFRDELPKNAVGRALKFQLRDEGVTPTTWDREVAGVAVPKR